MNEITPFNFNGAEIRTITKDGEPWFLPKDICTVIGITDYTQAVSKLDPDEKGTCLIPTLGGDQESLVINQSGLYTLILRCRDAVKEGSVPHRFRKWVTSEVLPAIRKTGGYQLPKNMPEALRLLADEVEKNQHLQLVIHRQQLAVEFVQKYVAAEGTFTIRETAKIVGMQQNAFVNLCLGSVLFRESGVLQPYAELIAAGYLMIKTGVSGNDHAFKQTKFTAKGVEWVRRYLKIDALLGNTEQKEAA